MYQNVTRTVGKEGLIGLQKLEAEGIIKPDFATRVGNIYKRDAVESGLSRAVARGIGWHSNIETILEMIEWLRDADYLIDYGQITISLAVSELREGKEKLEDSEFWKTLNYFRELMDDENEIFCLDFLLDYNRRFSQNMKNWLNELKSEQFHNEEITTVKTSCGYSYVYLDDDDLPPAVEGGILYIEACFESGMHYNRYQGFTCCD